MSGSVIVAPSILAGDFSDMGKQVRQIEQAGAEWLHVDVMDGHFVPNLTIGPVVVKSLRPVTNMIFDVHLMIEEPEKYAEAFIKAGGNVISFHCETRQDTKALIDTIHGLGAKAGLAIKPKTPMDVILPYLGILDVVIVMTVEPGFAGQKFMPEVLPKLKELKKNVDENPQEIIIQVDGGVNIDNAALIVDAGADCLVGGASVFSGPDPGQAVKDIKRAAIKQKIEDGR